MKTLPEHSLFLLFDTIHDVLRAEKALKRRGLAIELVPVPRNLSSDCGMAIRIDAGPVELTNNLADIGVSRAFIFDGTDYQPIVITG